MKLYCTKMGSSISMVFDDTLINSIKNISNDIDVIIETGTYTGEGSTRMISEIFKNSNIEKFCTIEINRDFYIKAKINLKKYDFVEILNGLSLEVEECIKFIEDDDFIKNHHLNDEIYIDNLENPIKFYTDEINRIDKDTEQNLLEKLIKENIGKRLFIVLDSAGGIGYLEFNKVMALLKDKKYYLLLDDIHHIKHFRSYEYIMNNEDFKVISLNYDKGWLLCEKKV